MSYGILGMRSFGGAEDVDSQGMRTLILSITIMNMASLWMAGRISRYDEGVWCGISSFIDKSDTPF